MSGKRPGPPSSRLPSIPTETLEHESVKWLKVINSGESVSSRSICDNEPAGSIIEFFERIKAELKKEDYDQFWMVLYKS